MPKSIHRDEFRAALRCLYELRQKAGLTQVELGQKMNRPQSFVSNGEGGFRRLDMLQLLEWANACGSDLATLGAMIDREVSRIPPPIKRAKSPPTNERKPKGKRVR